jgi:hypothetical protein
MRKNTTSSRSQDWSNLKKTIIGIGAIVLIGLLADVLGLGAFFGYQKSRVVNKATNANSDDSVNKALINDRPLNSTIVKNDSNFIDKYTYICEVTSWDIINACKAAGINNDKAGLIKAAMYFCENKNSLAYEYIIRYNAPPSGIDSVAFYTLKGNIVFFGHKYDLSYKYLLEAYYINKNSKYLDMRKLRDLTVTLGQLRNSGYSLEDIKGIEIISLNNLIYDLGFRKVRSSDDFIPINKIQTEDDKALIQLMRELKIINS